MMPGAWSTLLNPMISLKPVVSKTIWENFLLSSDQCTFLQSWNWGEFHQKLDHEIFHFGIFQANKLVGLSLLIEIKAKRGHYFECPGGPVLDWQNQVLVTEVFRQLKTFTSGFIRIRPNVADTSSLRQIVKSLGFIKAPMHLHAESTWVLDLNKSEAQLLADMRKNTRYGIKKSLSLALKVIQSQDIKDVKTLYRLQLAVAKRHHFVPFSLNYFEQQFKAFSHDNQIQLFKVMYQRQVLVIAFIIFYGPEAVYHYSGSADQYRDIPASYALQWAVIREAKRRGLQRYNFWGIASSNNPHHRFAGVTLFKTGFGGRPINYLPAHDLPLNWSYWLTYLFETIRRLIRHL